MFCQNCGAQVQPGQAYCGSCAKPLTGYTEIQRNRLERHVHLLGIFWIVYSAISLLGGVVLLIMARWLFGPAGYSNGAPDFLFPLLTAVAIYLLLKAVLGIISGIGLLQHTAWGRIIAIILAFLDIMHVPFGTALAIYTMWSLLGKGADQDYRSLPAPA